MISRKRISRSESENRMNIVFWIIVALSAFALWYSISKHFFRIGNDFTDMVNNIKHEIEKKDEWEDNENEK